jgi:hypothetical protein
MAYFTQEEKRVIEICRVMMFDTSSPFFGQPPRPGPPILTSAWYRPNGHDGTLIGIPHKDFNRIGPYRSPDLGLGRKAVRNPALAVWSWVHTLAHKLAHKLGYEWPGFQRQRANQKNSPLYKLPVELLVLIGEQLLPVSRLCLRRACIRFWIHLERLGPELHDGVLVRTEVLQLSVLLNQDARNHLQDQYNRRCDLADLNTWLHRRGCSGCLKIHWNSDHFSTTALSAALTSPKTRVCVGLEGSIDICEHISFSAECLLAGISDFRNLVIFCQMHRLVQDVDGNRCSRLEWDAAYGPRVEYHDGMRITIERRFYLFSVPLETNPTHQELFDALQRINGVICPHLRTSSPHLFYRTELTTECSLGVQDSLDLRARYAKMRRCGYIPMYYDEPEKCMFRSKCPHQECDTWFGLRRIDTIQYPIHHVIFEVKRSFVGDPTHPSWKAQVVSRERDVASVPKPTGCTSRYGSCKGPVCAARHHGLVITPHDLEGTMETEETM